METEGGRVVWIDGTNRTKSMGVRVFRCAMAKFLPGCLKEEILKTWVWEESFACTIRVLARRLYSGT